MQFTVNRRKQDANEAGWDSKSMRVAIDQKEKVLGSRGGELNEASPIR